MSNVSELENLVERLSQYRNTPSRLTNAAAELLVGGVVALKARIAELEAERDKMTALFNARCREAKLEVAESRAIAFEEARDSARALVSVARKARAIAFEEAAKAIESMPSASSEHYMDTVDRGHAAYGLRALATTPSAMVAVERKVLESVLLRAGALLSLGTEFGDRRDEENVRDIITSIAKALGTK